MSDMPHALPLRSRPLTAIDRDPPKTVVPHNPEGWGAWDGAIAGRISQYSTAQHRSLPRMLFLPSPIAIGPNAECLCQGRRFAIQLANIALPLFSIHHQKSLSPACCCQTVTEISPFVSYPCHACFTSYLSRTRLLGVVAAEACTR